MIALYILLGCLWAAIGIFTSIYYWNKCFNLTWPALIGWVAMGAVLGPIDAFVTFMAFYKYGDDSGILITKELCNEEGNVCGGPRIFKMEIQD